MTEQQIKNKLTLNHFSQWLKTRQLVLDEISDSQNMFCVCGRLATGLHESNCRKFQKLVDKETVSKLKYLVTNIKQ